MNGLVLLVASVLLAADADAVLFKAEPLAATGFSELIEGPACDADGNIYAVAYLKPDNIGKVTPDGKAEVFVTLPKWRTWTRVLWLRQKRSPKRCVTDQRSCS